jgi:hypothetical protein
MSTKALALSLLLIASLVKPSLLPAQVPESTVGTWAGVKTVPVGDELEVKLKEGRTVKGRLTSSSDTTLTVTRKGKSVQIDRADVFRVYRVIPKSSAKATLIGAGVGAAVGLAAIGAAAAADDTGGSEGELAAAAVGIGIVGAGIGALVGLAFGKRTRRVLIYEARGGTLG